MLNTATIRGPESSTISENIGSVDVCVNVSNAGQIPVGGAEIDVFVTNLGINPVTRKPQGGNQPNKILIVIRISITIPSSFQLKLTLAHNGKL